MSAPDIIVAWALKETIVKQLVALSSLSVLASNTCAAQTPPDWTEPLPPFKIAANLYYVGSKGLANYLITTPKGHVLINSDLVESVPLIRASVEKLGFKFGDIKILLISHAHWDHCAGSAAVKKLIHAKYMVMDADAPVVESGGKSDFQNGKAAGSRYPRTSVDRILHDGDEVKLGGSTLVAHLTPGHTKGCTTWTMKLTDNGTVRNAVIIGSPNVNPGYKLVNNPSYPGIARDYQRMFRVLKSLPCDNFLGAHGDYFNMSAKLPKLKSGAPSPFIDPDGYKKFVADKEQAFLAELAKQKAAIRRARVVPAPTGQVGDSPAGHDPYYRGDRMGKPRIGPRPHQGRVRMPRAGLRAGWPTV